VLSWWVLLGVTVLVFNDHWGKANLRGWWPGKLSDFAGMLFFPAMLQALWEVGQSALNRYTGPSRFTLIVCALSTGLVFSAINTWAPAADLYRVGLGALQWPFLAALSLIQGGELPALRRVVLEMDPSDLIATPIVFVAIGLGWNRHTYSS